MNPTGLLALYYCTTLLLPTSVAFSSSSLRIMPSRGPATYIKRNGGIQLRSMSDFFDEIGKFFENGIGKNYDKDGTSFNPQKGDIVNTDDDVDDAYTGSKRIVTIPAKSMKMGGLRLYCSLYLMGLQNTPEPKSWKAQQFDNSEVNLRYCDLSGSIIIQFTEDGITIDRLGSSPSMKYLLHESIVLNGFLDELHGIVFEGDVTEENRLLTLPDPGDAIEKARELLSFS